MRIPSLLFAFAISFQQISFATAQNKQTFTPHHVSKLRTVVAAATSPKGTYVAYVLNVPRNLAKEPDGPAWTELHVVDLAGNARPFIAGPVNVGGVAWTPTGNAVSFLAKRDNDKTRSLYVISPMGGESRKILEHTTDILSYSWSPDGKRVAFLATEPPDADEVAEREYGYNQQVYEEDDAFVKVWVATIGDSKKPSPMKMKGSAWDVVWAPKGDRLAVSVSPLPLIDHRFMFRAIHVLDAGTGRETAQLKVPGKMGQIAWSPHGEHLAVVAAVSKHDPMEGRLWIAPAKGGAWQDITPDLAGHVTKFAWNAIEGRDTELVAVIAKGVSTEVLSFPLTNGRLVGKPKAIIPGSGPFIVQDVSSSEHGSALAFIADTPNHPAEIYYKRQTDKQPRRLTDHNTWLKSMQFAKQEVVTYKARDGLQLDGILIRPLHEKKGKRYPLVVTVHGGPEALVGNGWVTSYFYLGQVGAANGFAVFYPNYRGSTGRGVPFSMMGQGDAAGKEFDDLVDGVDHLVETGLADKDAIGITGGSYGGYATAWGATYYSHRFAAGVMFVGVSNGVSKTGTTDIPNEVLQVHHRKSLWNDWNYFLKSSPIYYVEKAKTPLLILHGKSDPRVHPGQSMELYRHLKMLGKTPVRLVLYPGEGHGNRRTASRLDYNLRLLRWMKHYLSGRKGDPPPRRVDYGPNAPAKGVNAKTVRWRRPALRLQQDRQWLFDLPPNSCPCCIWP